MTAGIIRDQKIWFGGFDLTGVSNSLALDYGCDTQEKTVLGDDTHKMQAGLKTVSAGCEGFFDAVTDARLFGEIGAAGKLLSYAATDAPGGPVYMFRAMLGSYNPQGGVGEMFKFSLSAAAEGALIRGKLAANGQAVQATGAGLALNLGPVGAGKKIYAGLHVLGAAAGGSLSVAIKTDSANDFSGGETARIAFDAATATGSQLKELVGPITDGWQKVFWTVTGDTPSFDFIVIIAIQ